MYFMVKTEDASTFLVVTAKLHNIPLEISLFSKKKNRKENHKNEIGNK
jgi:hypothetical protein